MKKEFETKVLNIYPEKIIKKLRMLDAKETPEVLLRRYVFIIKSKDLEWIRLRNNGKNTTLTYKHKKRGSVKIGGTNEIEVKVSGFTETAEILRKIYFQKIEYQENKRHCFYLNDIEFSIDTWPMLRPHLEIESRNLEKIQEGLHILNLTGKDIGDKGIIELYKDKGIDIHAYPELKFKTYI